MYIPVNRDDNTLGSTCEQKPFKRHQMAFVDSQINLRGAFLKPFTPIQV